MSAQVREKAADHGLDPVDEGRRSHRLSHRLLPMIARRPDPGIAICFGLAIPRHAFTAWRRSASRST